MRLYLPVITIAESECWHRFDFAHDLDISTTIRGW